MGISEVARRTGIAASALRDYERRGLIALGRPGRHPALLAPGVLDQLALIALGQAAGLSLDEVQSMLSPDGEPDIDRAPLAEAMIDGEVRQRGDELGGDTPPPARRRATPVPDVPEAAEGRRRGRPRPASARRRSRAARPTGPAVAHRARCRRPRRRLSAAWRRGAPCRAPGRRRPLPHAAIVAPSHAGDRRSFR